MAGPVEQPWDAIILGAGAAGMMCAAVAASVLLSTAFLAATSPAPPPGFPQFPPGVVASTLRGSGVTGMPAPPAW